MSEADEHGPGGGRRDHRDDGCFLRLLKPAVVIAALLSILRR